MHWLWIKRFIVWSSRRLGRSPMRRAVPRSADLHGNLYGIRHKEEAVTMCAREQFRVDDLLRILASARRLDVTDNRDRIYAFLGLPGAEFIRNSLNIQYDNTWETVFRDFACCYLDCTHDLELLHSIQPTETTVSADTKYPSWAPSGNTMCTVISSTSSGTKRSSHNFNRCRLHIAYWTKEYSK